MTVTAPHRLRSLTPGVTRSTPGRRERTPAHLSSLPFLGGVAALLALALLGLLMINNTLAVGSFEQSRLKSDQILLGEQEQALRQEVERLSSPTRVREAARAAGLVAAATTVYLDPVTGSILGTPAAAGRAELGLPVTDPTATVPATDPAAAPAPATPADPAAVTDPSAADVGNGAVAPEPAGGAGVSDPAGGETPGQDGAVVGAPPGSTAYDRAVVSGGGR